MLRADAVKIRKGDTVSAGTLGIWNAVVTKIVRGQNERFFPKFEVRLIQGFPATSTEHCGLVNPFTYSVITSHVPFPAVVTGQGNYTRVRL